MNNQGICESSQFRWVATSDFQLCTASPVDERNPAVQFGKSKQNTWWRTVNKTWTCIQAKDQTTIRWMKRLTIMTFWFQWSQATFVIYGELTYCILLVHGSIWCSGSALASVDFIETIWEKKSESDRYCGVLWCLEPGGILNLTKGDIPPDRETRLGLSARQLSSGVVKHLLYPLVI